MAEQKIPLRLSQWVPKNPFVVVVYNEIEGKFSSSFQEATDEKQAVLRHYAQEPDSKHMLEYLVDCADFDQMVNLHNNCDTPLHVVKLSFDEQGGLTNG